MEFYLVNFLSIEALLYSCFLSWSFFNCSASRSYIRISLLPTDGSLMILSVFFDSLASVPSEPWTDAKSVIIKLPFFLSLEALDSLHLREFSNYVFSIFFMMSF